MQRPGLLIEFSLTTVGGAHAKPHSGVKSYDEAHCGHPRHRPVAPATYWARLQVRHERAIPGRRFPCQFSCLQPPSFNMDETMNLRRFEFASGIGRASYTRLADPRQPAEAGSRGGAVRKGCLTVLTCGRCRTARRTKAIYKNASAVNLP